MIDTHVSLTPMMSVPRVIRGSTDLDTCVTVTMLVIGACLYSNGMSHEENCKQIQ